MVSICRYGLLLYHRCGKELFGFYFGRLDGHKHFKQIESAGTRNLFALLLVFLSDKRGLCCGNV